MQEDFLKIENIKFWARVGVLEEERLYGQLFSLDVSIWNDFSDSEKNDDLKSSLDYSVIVNDIKTHAAEFSCNTIEKFSCFIIEIIKSKFSPKRIKIKLTKCNPPIVGFDGKVSIIRYSHN